MQTNAEKTGQTCEALLSVESDGPGSSPLVKTLTLAAMSLGYGVVQLDVTIVNTAFNGFSALATDLAFVPMMGAVLPANLLAARATERFGAPVVIAAGAMTAAVGCSALIPIERGTNYWIMCVQLVAVGGGLGLLVPPLTSALLGTECARKRKRPQFPRFYETSDSELFSNGQRPVVRSNAKTDTL